MEKKEEFKRKRSENWNEDDKMLLKELIRKRAQKRENKNTDTNTNHTKKKAWLEVVGSFNELYTGGQRNMTQLKTQWAATKISARKEVPNHRKKVSKTGGGLQPPEIPLNNTDISVWLPNEFVVDSNEFDSDYILNELSVEAVDEETNTITLENEEVIDVDATEMYNEVKLPKFIPKSTPILKKFCISKTV